MTQQPRIEQLCLAYLIDNPQATEELNNIFPSNIGSQIYKAIKNLYDTKREITVDNIVLETSKMTPKLNITDEKIDLILSTKIDNNSFEEYKKELKAFYVKEKLKSKEGREFLIELEKEGNDLDEIKRIIKSLESRIQELGSDEKDDFILLQGALENYEQVIRDRASDKNNYPTGFQLLDKHFPLGFAPSYMTTIFGTSGMGKTTKALNLVNTQINLRIPNVYGSFELNLTTVLDKLLSLRLGIPISTIMRAKDENGNDVSDSIIDQVRKERDKLKSNRNFVILEEDSFWIKDLDDRIPKIKKYMKTDFFILHLDLATMLMDFRKSGDLAGVYQRAVDDLHVLAKKHNIHIINYVQSLRDKHDINVKKIEDIEKFRPRLNSIKNSGAFEERSRLVIGLFRPYYYADRYLKDDPRTKLMTDIMEVIFLKNSLGTLPSLDFLFKGDIGRLYAMQETRSKRDGDDFDEEIEEALEKMKE